MLLFASLIAHPTLASPTSATEGQLYVKQGGVIPVKGVAAPGLNVTIQLTGSNGDAYIQVFQVPADGRYLYNYTMSAEPDVYRLTIDVNGAQVKAYSVVVTKADVADTVASMIQSTSATIEGARVYVAELEAKGIQITEGAAEGMGQAQTMIEEAARLLEGGDARGAWSKVKAAQETIRRVFKSIDQPQTPPVEESAGSVMRQTLQRALEYHEKLNSTVGTLAGRGIDVSKIKTALRQARGLLRDAEDSIGENNRLRFEVAIREAAQLMNQVNSLIQGEMSRVKIALAAKYREGMQSRVNNIRQLLSAYQSKVPLSEGSKVSAALSLTEEKLSRLQATLASNSLDIGAMKDISDDIKSALQSITDEDVRRLFEEMSSIKARIEEASQSGPINGSTYYNKLQYESLRLQRIREYLKRLSSSTGSRR